MNVDGLNEEKWNTIKDKAQKPNFPFNTIVLTETYRRPSVTEKSKLNLKMEGWRCWEFVSGKFCAGRVFIAMRTELKATRVRIDSSIEQLYVTATVQDQDFGFVGLYIPPSSPTERYQYHVNLVARKMLENPKLRIVALGDFNVQVSDFLPGGGIVPAKTCTPSGQRGGLVLSKMYDVLGYKQVIAAHPEKCNYSLDLCWLPRWMAYECTTVEPMVTTDKKNHLAIKVKIPVNPDDTDVSRLM